MESMLTYDNCQQEQGVLNFTVFSHESNPLPFPLNLNLFWRSIISAFLLAILIVGTRLRMKIVSYIRSPDTKLNETNILFCLDQVNGIFLSIMIVYSISFIMLNDSVAELIDPHACNFNSALHAMYLSGTLVWSSYIAIYRVLFIKAHRWLIEKIGSNNLLALMIASGLTVIIGYSIVVVTTDQITYSRRSCHRWTFEAGNIIESYQVLA